MRRPYPPGQHGQGRIKLSEYGLRLREKQKMRRIYGLLEAQFRGYYARGDAPARAAPARRCSACIERRLDNVVLPHGLRGQPRAGRASSSRHNHVLVNGKRVNIPSYLVNAGRQDRDPREEPQDQVRRGGARGGRKRASASSWLEVDKDNFAGMFKALPVRDELNEPMIREQYVVEYYSALDQSDRNAGRPRSDREERVPPALGTAAQTRAETRRGPRRSNA